MITDVAKTQPDQAEDQEAEDLAVYKVLGPAMAIPAGIVVRKAADTAWLKVRGYPPPKNPAAPGVTWPDAAGLGRRSPACCTPRAGWSPPAARRRPTRS